MAALALVLCVVGSVGATNFVTNGTFDQGLNAWQAWASGVNDFGNTYWTDPLYVTVAVTQEALDKSLINPALTWYRWNQDPSYDTGMAIGARQQVGGTAGINPASYGSFYLAADFNTVVQNWANADQPLWFSTLLGIRYKNADGSTGYEAQRYIINPANTTTTHESWDLKPFFNAKPGAKITGIFVGGQGNAFEAQADNITLYGGTGTVPEPSGLMALATALSGAGLFMRRRRK